MKNSHLYYSVGALLYCPANNTTIADSIIHERFGTRFSLALCLEDTINDRFLTQAESILIQTLQQIYQAAQSLDFFMPKIFIRVRTAAQIINLIDRLGSASIILSGFILPKFDLKNANCYIQTAITINESGKHPFYIMPIIESPSVIDLRHRANILYELKESLTAAHDLVLNIRVGGNDLCHAFGFRRHSNESIHKILPIESIFSDIMTIFGMDYVISGPVWEYYNGDGWDTGLRQELMEDRLFGFVGKTVIHPKQIPFVNKAYAVSKEDYEDAKSILNWDDTSISMVSGNVEKNRMNECKTHSNWAQKIIYLSQVYGIKEPFTE